MHRSSPSPKKTACRPPLLRDAEQTFGPRCCQAGLGGVERREKIDPINPRNILGSVNIDAVYSEKEPNAPRWDCLVGYLSEAPRACFVEFHEANRDSCITEVKSKLEWLMGKLQGSPFLTPRWKASFHWIVSSAGPEASSVVFTKREVTAKMAPYQIEFEGRGPLKLE
jgi:hypothetical protein